MLRNLFVGFIAAILLNTGAAQAAVVTFEGHGDNIENLQFHDGFTFQFVAAGWGIVTDGFVGFGAPYTQNGTTRLILSGGLPGQVIMSQTNGDLFSLQGLAAAVLFPGRTGTIDITGNLFGGGTISTSIDVDDTFDDYALSGFTNLVSVVFAESVSGSFLGNPGLSLDNLIVNAASAVPEPHSLALFGIAGLGLLFAKKRRRA